MPNYYSPEGNYEVWKEKPEGYFTAEEWLKSHPPETQYPALAIQSEIAELKEQLTASDYKIIKYSEYQFSGLESPYDIARYTRNGK